MADTHINAFFADVDEKQKVFNQAVAELDVAEAALEVKKKEVGWIEPEEVDQVQEPEESKQPISNIFKKK